MKDRYQTIPRTMCLIMNRGRILLIEFSEKKGAMQGFFNCPGGHIEPGEGIIENAEKEIFEETGLRVSGTKLKGVIHSTNFFGKNIISFVTLSKTDSSEVIDGDEGKLHWVDLDKLDIVNLIEDVKIILEKLNTIGENDIFTAKSEFDGGGNLLKMEFEQ
jgi:ADP-ribose pyrophosphatase YjhB (NUDIX family)